MDSCASHAAPGSSRPELQQVARLRAVRAASRSV
jgi:hypothetical protein